MEAGFSEEIEEVISLLDGKVKASKRGRTRRKTA
jgi:hypothetical protein